MCYVVENSLLWKGAKVIAKGELQYLAPLRDIKKSKKKRLDLTGAGNSNVVAQGPIVGVSAVGALELVALREQCQVTRISAYALCNSSNQIP